MRNPDDDSCVVVEVADAGPADWVEDARRYIAVRSALDRLESAALLSRDDEDARL